MQIDFLLFILKAWDRELPLKVSHLFNYVRILEVLTNHQHSGSTEDFYEIFWSLNQISCFLAFFEANLF